MNCNFAIIQPISPRFLDHDVLSTKFGLGMRFGLPILSEHGVFQVQQFENTWYFQYFQQNHGCEILLKQLRIPFHTTLKTPFAISRQYEQLVYFE